MGSNQNDFTVDSKGRCFLCLDKISTVKHDQGQGAQTFPKYSLYYLSRYLKMDMMKVFKDTKQIPSYLLSMVENSRLKVELCEECAILSEHFSENYRKLEKAEMELESSLIRIHQRFLDSNESSGAGGMTKKFKKLTDVEPLLQLSTGGKLEILEVLREEAFEKSHWKLCAGVPRVKFRKLARKEISIAEKLKCMSNVDIANEPKSPVPAPCSRMTDDSPKADLKTGDSETKLQARDVLSSDHDNCSPDGLSTDNVVMCAYPEDTKLVMEKNDDDDMNLVPLLNVDSPLVTKIGRKSKTKSESEKPVWKMSPKTGKYKCDACPQEFSVKTKVQRHYDSVHLKIRFKCDTCGKEFSQRDACNRHQRSAHVGVRYDCQICKKSFPYSFNVRVHQQSTECGKKLGL